MAKKLEKIKDCFQYSDKPIVYFRGMSDEEFAKYSEGLGKINQDKMPNKLESMTIEQIKEMNLKQGDKIELIAKNTINNISYQLNSIAYFLELDNRGIIFVDEYLKFPNNKDYYPRENAKVVAFSDLEKINILQNKQ